MQSTVPVKCFWELIDYVKIHPSKKAVNGGNFVDETNLFNKKWCECKELSDFDKPCETLIVQKALCFSRLESLETRLEHFSKALGNFTNGLERL